MSWKATSIVKNVIYGLHGEKLSMADKLVLLLIAEDWNDDYKRAWTSQRKQAARCSCTERGLRGILERLVRFGLLQIVHRQRLGNHYRLPFMRNPLPQSCFIIEEREDDFEEQAVPAIEEPPFLSSVIEPIEPIVNSKPESLENQTQNQEPPVGNACSACGAIGMHHCPGPSAARARAENKKARANEREIRKAERMQEARESVPRYVDRPAEPRLRQPYQPRPQVEDDELDKDYPRLNRPQE